MNILAVMVRYRMPLSESETVRGWRNALRERPELSTDYRLLIWDNSPEATSAIELPVLCAYRHSEENLGVSGAFNWAIDYARNNGFAWMLLLDQDTALTADFLATMLRHSNEQDSQARIAAIAPTVRVRGFVVSPRRQLFNHHRAYPQGESGIAPGEAFAINSGCMMRIAALEAIGGYSTDFWLDYSDMYVFHQLYLHGWKVWRAADAELEHEMSVMDYDRLMTPARYRHFSIAESAFNDLYKGRLENLVQTLRLLARAIRQRKKYRNPEFSRIAWEQMIYRLRVPRSKRLTQWFEEGSTRLAIQGEHTKRTEQDTTQPVVPY
jgi:GT2 family glycosyltransferase